MCVALLLHSHFLRKQRHSAGNRYNPRFLQERMSFQLLTQQMCKRVLGNIFLLELKSQCRLRVGNLFPIKLFFSKLSMQCNSTAAFKRIVES